MGGVGLSSVLHSQSDMLLSSAVKLNMEGRSKDFNSNLSNLPLVAGKKKKKKSKKKKEVGGKVV